ncbi:hypothetical protein CBG53_04120 [Porphyromonas gingivalis]|uniref:DUF1661 domain-containing protein n=1 Tax=Porphyromonas gingivalis TaxID=837 RepID=UPI000985A434|nr:DUF1661 domain-containing protein [Porphyromonas gingivalis]OWP32099.1 hypothetical protein CBG53_04120 [Porphyromonas gingivalis]
MVREIKNSRATTKNFLFRFFRKHAPQSEHFRLVFYTPPSPLFYFQCGFRKIPRNDGCYISDFLANKHKKYALITAFRVTLGH